LKELKGRLIAGQSSAITAVQGLGGIGKTTLAKQAAYELYHEKHFGAVLWADVTPKPDPLLALTEWARYADPLFSPDGNHSLEGLARQVKALLEELLAEKQAGRTLVVLDDVWDGPDEAGRYMVRLLRSACPSAATLLLTTRNEGLALDLGAAVLNLQRLTQAEGVELLRAYLSGEDGELLGRLVTVLGGHPLALTLAARRVQKKKLGRATALDNQLAEYERKLPALAEFADLKLDAGQKREDNLTLVLSYSYDELEAEEQARFRRLGALAYDRPFDLPLLAFLWELDPNDERERAGLEQSLEQLLLLSLVESDEPEASLTGEDNGPEVGWYRQYPLLQAYARALLKQNAAEYRAATAHYQEGVIGLADQFYELPPQEWISRGLKAYQPHLLEVGASLLRETGLSFPADGRGEPSFTAAVTPEVAGRALVFALNTYTYLFHRREVREAGWLWLGLTAARQLSDRQRESLFLAELGLFYSQMGEQATGLARYEQALALDRELGNQQGEATTLTNIGKVYADLGHQDQALAYYNQALPLRRAVGDRAGEAATLNNIGSVYSALGHKEQALTYYSQALPLRRAVGDQQGEAQTLNNIGAVYDALGHKEQALTYYNQTLALIRAGGNKTGEAATLNNIGMVYSALGNQNQALAYYNQALPLIRAVGYRAGEAATLHNIGGVYRSLGEQDQALDYYNQALPLRRFVGDRAGEANTLNNMGLVYDALGDKDQALSFYNQALLLFQAVGDRAGEAATLSNIGSVYSDLGDKDKALSFYNQALPLRRAVGDRDGEGYTRHNLGVLLWEMGRYAEGLAMVEQALALFQAVQSPKAKTEAGYLAQMRAALAGGGG